MLACLAVHPAPAGSWEAELGSGQGIAVDPSTNRAVIRDGTGQGRPLWDGVHRLRDGSTITIRSGVMVPNEDMASFAPVVPPPEADTPGGAAPAGGGCRGHSCDDLVLKCCGLHGSCADSEACVLARQLRRMQQTSDCVPDGGVGWAEDQCRTALRDEPAFAPCPREPSLDTVACRRLVAHVCAGRPRCAASASCRSAQELFDLEQVALEKGAAEELELIRPRCREMLRDHAFFPPCR